MAEAGHSWCCMRASSSMCALGRPEGGFVGGVVLHEAHRWVNLECQSWVRARVGVGAGELCMALEGAARG